MRLWLLKLNQAFPTSKWGISAYKQLKLGHNLFLKLSFYNDKDGGVVWLSRTSLITNIDLDFNHFTKSSLYGLELKYQAHKGSIPHASLFLFSKYKYVKKVLLVASGRGILYPQPQNIKGLTTEKNNGWPKSKQIEVQCYLSRKNSTLPRVKKQV